MSTRGKNRAEDGSENAKKELDDKKEFLKRLEECVV